MTAGLAARAVWEIAPDKFYEWHRAMFDKQDDENAGWGKKEDVLALTRTIAGIDVPKVEQLMTDHAAEYQSAIQADGTEGSSMGIDGTPGAIIGKRLLVGAQPYDQFKAAVDAALAGK
jgi:protein-disulfide isomerase